MCLLEWSEHDGFGGKDYSGCQEGAGKDAAKEVYIAAFPVLRARFFERCKAAHMTGNAVMNRMAEEYLSDLAVGRDRSRELCHWWKE